MVLAKDKKDNYLIYRFGTADKIDLEFPKEKNKQSFKKFTFSTYLRGGGIQNEGMDLNGVHFMIADFEYSVFQNYYAVGNKIEIGVEIKNLKTNKITAIFGNPKTVIGTLILETIT